MKQKKNPNLRLVRSVGSAKQKRVERKFQMQSFRKWLIRIALVMMVLGGTLLLVENWSYSDIATFSSEEQEISDSSQYEQFSNGVVRYSRDGIVFLDWRNREKWIHPCQMNSPMIDVQKHVFAVADRGGTSILIFSKDGVKGEIETALPIEKISLSDQGVVAVLFQSEETPELAVYDATGKVYVEYEVQPGVMGYPTALALSQDGQILSVGYLVMSAEGVSSRVEFYHFGEDGKRYENRKVLETMYEDMVVPEVYFMNQKTAVVMTDTSMQLYEWKDGMKLKREISLSQEVKSTFHTNSYFGVVLYNRDTASNEVRIFTRRGRQILNKSFSGEYSEVRMVGREVILYSGSKCYILKTNGIERFRGDLGVEVSNVIPKSGWNRYLLTTSSGVRTIFLVK